MSETTDLQPYQDFLQRLSQGQATIPDWNQFVVRRSSVNRWEPYRKALSDHGLTIGQCSGIPFPPPLQELAARLLEEWLDQGQ